MNKISTTGLFTFGILFLSSIFLMQACNSDDAAVTPVPLTISQVAPETGIVGTTVSINGTSFSATASENSVKFNGTLAPVTSATSSSLKVNVPAGASTGKITVQTGGQTVTSTIDFIIINPPTITSFTPATGTVGSVVTITGTNFITTLNENIVKINGTLATVTEATTTTLKVTVQTGTSTGKIEVKTGGLTVTSGNDFTYSAITVSTFAGLEQAFGNGGYTDGASTVAQFRCPIEMATDKSGNVYVSDLCNFRIRKITPDGTVSTIAGNSTNGYAEGTGTAAQFNSPYGIVVDDEGNIYVSDSGNNRIRKITTAGVVSTFAGSGVSGFADGTGSAAQFSNPKGLAIDAIGNLYVVDGVANSRIRKITSAGVVSTLAGNGTAGFANGTGTAAIFNEPRDIAVDASGNLYVTDTDNHMIRKITPDGVVSTLAGHFQGFTDGSSEEANFKFPVGIAIDTDGNLYVGDQGNERIRKITTNGVVVTLAGNGTYGFVNGTGTEAQFRGTSGVAVDASGNVFVADQSNNVIRKIKTP